MMTITEFQEASVVDSIESQYVAQPSVALIATEPKTLWQRMRAGVMFAVACIASPCCTPLVVPLVLALLAGTPLAVWLGSNLGWVYGGLTLISVVSFVTAFRWMNKPAASRPTPIRPSAIPVITTQAGDTTHVN
jgi:hypothetical protein